MTPEESGLEHIVSFYPNGINNQSWDEQLASNPSLTDVVVRNNRHIKWNDKLLLCNSNLSPEFRISLLESYDIADISEIAMFIDVPILEAIIDRIKSDNIDDEADISEDIDEDTDDEEDYESNSPTYRSNSPTYNDDYSYPSIDYSADNEEMERSQSDGKDDRIASIILNKICNKAAGITTEALQWMYDSNYDINWNNIAIHENTAEWLVFNIDDLSEVSIFEILGKKWMTAGMADRLLELGRGRRSNLTRLICYSSNAIERLEEFADEKPRYKAHSDHYFILRNSQSPEFTATFIRLFPEVRYDVMAPIAEAALSPELAIELLRSRRTSNSWMNLIISNPGINSDVIYTYIEIKRRPAVARILADDATEKITMDYSVIELLEKYTKSDRSKADLRGILDLDLENTGWACGRTIIATVYDAADLMAILDSRITCKIRYMGTVTEPLLYRLIESSNPNAKMDWEGLTRSTDPGLIALYPQLPWKNEVLAARSYTQPRRLVHTKRARRSPDRD